MVHVSPMNMLSSTAPLGSSARASNLHAHTTSTFSPLSFSLSFIQAMTFDLSSPIPDQVNAGGRPHLPGTHNGEASAVSLVRVVPTVVLAVAGQRGVDAASWVKARVTSQRREKRLGGPEAIKPQAAFIRTLQNPF